MAKKKKPEAAEPGVTPIATNRKASFDFELGERFEAGLVLMGSEVKALRNRSASIGEAWASVSQNEAWVEGMRIAVLDHAAFGHTKETRPRKLLLHRKEIDKLRSAIERQGVTVVVTRLYFRHGHAKVEIALAHGRKKADKREAIKVKDAARDARAELDRARKRGG